MLCSFFLSVNKRLFITKSTKCKVFQFQDIVDGVDYWVAKNSWGLTWGEAGYLRVAKNLGHCGIGTFLSVPICN